MQQAPAPVEALPAVPAPALTPVTPELVLHLGTTSNSDGRPANVLGYGAVVFEVSGQFAAQVHFEASATGGPRTPIQVVGSDGQWYDYVTQPGLYWANVSGLELVFAPVRSYTGGAVTVKARASSMPAVPNRKFESMGGSVLAHQGDPRALDGAWPTKITDGTSVLGTASAPVRTDPTGTTPQPVTQANPDNLNANANLQVGNVDVSNANPVPVSDAGGALTVDGAVDVTDRAARDLGKVDVASLDQYTPIDVDTSVGVVNALPVTWRKSGVGAPEFGTATDPVRIDPTGATPQPVTDAGGSLTVDGAVTANQGTAAPLSGAWPVQVTDGTNVLGTAANPVRIDPTGTTTQPVDTELPAAAALGDGVANPTTPTVGSAALVFNGTGWDRLRAAGTYKVLPRTALAANGSANIWTPAAGKRIRLLSFHVTVSAATVLTLKLGTTVIWERDFGAAGGADVLLPLNGGIVGAADEVLSVTSSAAATVGATAAGTVEE